MAAQDPDTYFGDEELREMIEAFKGLLVPITEQMSKEQDHPRGQK